MAASIPSYRPLPPNSAAPPIHVPVAASWRNVAQQVRTLLTRSPWLVGTLAAGAGVGLLLAYRSSQASRRAAAARRRISRLVRHRFDSSLLDILAWVHDQAWNHLSPAALDRLFHAFLALLGDKRRGLLPLSDLAQLYRRAGVGDERVALACARFWDVDGNGVVDFAELSERLNLALFGSKVAQLRAYFKVFDLDASGRINKSEMEEVLRALRSGESRSVQHETVQRIFQHVDRDGDGLISLADFLELAEIENLSMNFTHEFVKAFGLDATTQGIRKK